MRIKPHLLYVFLIAVNFWILPAVIRNTGMAMVMMLAGLAPYLYFKRKNWL